MFRKKMQSAIRVASTFGLVEAALLSFRLILQREKRQLILQNHGGLSKDLAITQVQEIIGISSAEWETVQSDFNRYEEQNAKQKRSDRESFFGSIYDLGPATSEILFSLCRLLKPQIVVETGVAAGRSTDATLRALSLNGSGKLFSFDVTEKVGQLIDPEHRREWTLKVLPRLRRKKHFLLAIQELSHVDIFLHDSDHTQDWQLFEIETVIQCHPWVKVIIVDDVTPFTLEEIPTRYPKFSLLQIQESTKLSAIFINAGQFIT